MGLEKTSTRSARFVERCGGRRWGGRLKERRQPEESKKRDSSKVPTTSRDLYCNHPKEMYKTNGLGLGFGVKQFRMRPAGLLDKASVS